MFGLLRLLIVWRLLRLLLPLALCGLLVATLAGSRPAAGLSERAPRSLSALERSLHNAFGPEITQARRAVTSALLSGRLR